MYQNIHHSNQQETEMQSRDQRNLDLLYRQRQQDLLLGNIPSDATGKALPASRNGLITRGSLRTAKLSTGDITQMLLEQVDEVSPRDAILSADKKKRVSREGRSNDVPQTLKASTPRTVILDNDMKVLSINPKKSSKKRTVEAMGKATSLLKRDHYIMDFERPYYKECEPVMEPSVHPTCNSLHEMTLESIDISLISDSGSWRSAWKVDLDMPTTTTNTTKTTSSSLPTVVLKLLHLRREFDHQSYHAHAADIMVMDRLTASPHVVNAYAFCGQSVVTEYATSSGRDYVKRYDISNRDRLRIARDLAHGLADIQALRPSVMVLREEVSPVFAHNDINIANVVMVNGKMKWNDFNIGEMLRHFPGNGSITASRLANISNASAFSPFTETNSNNKDRICPVPVKYDNPLWRAPEEILNKSYVRVDASDIYGFGNILYQTMTRHQPWTHKEPEGKLSVKDIASRKMNGRTPTIPDQYRNATKRELQIMYVATVACHNPDPNRRPSAKHLAYGLQTLYERMNNKTRIFRADILDLILPPDAT
jgi:hypothetical protein